MTHDIKCWPDFFAATIAGSKLYEFRLNDRDYREGDSVLIREWSPKTESYTGNTALFHIGYILTGMGVPEGWCVFSLVKPSKQKTHGH